jgi:pimeloyl-ACP methyl ester carboxylesterase
MERNLVSTKKGDIEYTITGKGIPVLFMHGGHSNCMPGIWHEGFDPFEYQIITPSRPGYGGTPLGANGSPEKTAELMVGLLDKLSIEKVILYGISAGGLSSISMAANHSKRVDKLILASALSGDWLKKDEKNYKVAHVLFRPGTEKLTWAAIRFFASCFPGAMAWYFFQEFSSCKFTKKTKKEIKQLVAMLKDFRSGEGFLNDIHQTINAQMLAQIKCPTLILHSIYDKSVPFSHAQHAHDGIKNATLVPLENHWGHLIWIGDTSKTIWKHTSDFIKKHPYDPSK